MEFQASHVDLGVAQHPGLTIVDRGLLFSDPIVQGEIAQAVIARPAA